MDKNFVRVMKKKGLGEAHVLLAWLWFLNNIFSGIQATMHDMACKCGNMPSGKFSSQLNKLVKLGIVEKIPAGKDKYLFRIAKENWIPSRRFYRHNNPPAESKLPKNQRRF